MSDWFGRIKDRLVEGVRADIEDQRDDYRAAARMWAGAARNDGGLMGRFAARQAAVYRGRAEVKQATLDMIFGRDGEDEEG